MNVADGIWWSKEDMSNSDANSRVIVRFSRWICLAMVYVAKFSSPITAWSGSLQFLCTHCYDPIHIRKIRIRRSRAHKFSAAYSRFKGICLAMVYVAKFSSPITAWSGSLQFLCTHCYDPIHIRKIRIRRSRARKFSTMYSRFKGSSTLLFGIMKLSIPLAVNELIGSCYFA